MRLARHVALALSIGALHAAPMPAQAQGQSGAQAQSFRWEKRFDEMTPAEHNAAKKAALTRKLIALRVCADPGNMPLSNQNREGFQNKIVEILARTLNTRATWFWRPYIERGLTRETFANNECDILVDMPVGTPGVLTTVPVYRTTYVFASRAEDGIHIENLDDPKLKQLRIGVFQHSGLREALALHGIKNVVIHPVSQRADLVPEEQPWRQVQSVLDGKIDIAGVWGPFAGWVKAKGGNLHIQPANLMEDRVPLEFSLAIGVRETDAVLKYVLDNALEQAKDEIRKVLEEFGVPLVQCSGCVITGDIPSHGSYYAQYLDDFQKRFTEPLPAEAITLNREEASADQIVDPDRVESWLKSGASLEEELANAALASDYERVEWLIEKGANPDQLNKQGVAPLHIAASQRDSAMIELLLEKGANPNLPDRDGWTPLIHACWRDHVPSVEALGKHGADLEKPLPGGYSPLAFTLAEGKFWAAKALIEAGASPGNRSGPDDLTPLMVIASQTEASNRTATLAKGPGSLEIARLLIAKGADVNGASRNGVTPLMVAATHNNAPMIGLLLSSGADPQLKEKSGKTALAIAEANQNAAAAQALRIHSLVPGGVTLR